MENGEWTDETLPANSIGELCFKDVDYEAMGIMQNHLTLSLSFYHITTQARTLRAHD